MMWGEQMPHSLLMVILVYLPCVTSLRPNMDNTITNMTVIEGRTAILPCIVSNLGRHQVKVVWLDKWKTVLTLNEGRIIDDARYSVSHQSDEEWNLHLDKVKYGDQGLFTCQINTEPPMSQAISLSVVVPPRILTENEPSTITVREGEKATLTCNATGIPRPTVTWYRQPSAKGDSRERIGYTGEILVIHNVTRFCGGVYECEAENGYPPSVKRATMVRVKFHPEVHVENKRLTQMVGKDTILECTVSGYPQAEAAWKFEDRQLSNTEKYKLDIFTLLEDETKLTLYLNIKDLQKSDFGDYVCMASNDMGQAIDRMVLEEYKRKPTTTPPTTTTSTTTALTTNVQTFIQNTNLQSQNFGNKPQGRAGVGHHRQLIDDKRMAQSAKSGDTTENSAVQNTQLSSVCNIIGLLLWSYSVYNVLPL
ncbi:unnamed protein product [Lymnaea stagnalis]|uniref:Ig-like domain-containing protein n=1 Tax=Lymnaea stagnalis TaxID=6523 RepID=A0AAV2HMX6_LYMST